MSTHNLCVWEEIQKISEFLSENFQFLVVKFSIYLNRHVFIMYLISLINHSLISMWRANMRFRKPLIFISKKENISVLTLNIAILKLLTIHPKLLTHQLYSLLMCLKPAGQVSKSVDPIRYHIMQCLIWVYTVCSGLSVPILRVNTKGGNIRSILNMIHTVQTNAFWFWPLVHN